MQLDDNKLVESKLSFNLVYRGKHVWWILLRLVKCASSNGRPRLLVVFTAEYTLLCNSSIGSLTTPVTVTVFDNYFLYTSLVAIVGFNQTTRVVGEDAGAVEVCASFLEPTDPSENVVVELAGSTSPGIVHMRKTSTPHSVYINTDSRRIAMFLPISIWFVHMRFGQTYKTFLYNEFLDQIII